MAWLVQGQIWERMGNLVKMNEKMQGGEIHHLKQIETEVIKILSSMCFLLTLLYLNDTL